MRKITSFPFTFVDKTPLGKIYRPYAVLQVFSGKTNYWESLRMVIDTGADYTLLPNKYAKILEVDLQKDCIPEITLGVGGVETVYHHKGLKFKLNEFEFEAPVGFFV